MKNSFFTSLFIIASSVWAEPFTLSDTLKLSLEKNKEILIAEKRLEKAKAQVREAYSAVYPSLSLKGEESYLKKIKEIEGEPKPPPYTTSISLLLSQPLYTGGKLSSAIALAKLQLEMAELGYRLTKQDVLWKVAEAYYNLMRAIETKKVFEEEKGRAKTLFEIAEKRFFQGVILEVEVKRIKLNLRDIQTKFYKAEGDLEIAEDNLKKAIGLVPDYKIRPTEGLEHKPIELKDDAISDALANRLEIKEADLELKAKELSLKIIKGEYYPQVNLRASYGLIGNKDTFKKAIDDIEEDQYSLGLELELPIFDGGRRSSKCKSANLSVDEEGLNLERRREVITYEVREAIIRLKEAETKAETVKESLELAKENLEIMQLKYKEGAASLIETLDAENSLSKASLDYVGSLIDHQLSKVIFYKTTGRIEELLR